MQTSANILFRLLLLLSVLLVSLAIATPTVNVFNISSDIDKDELWNALLRREIPLKRTQFSDEKHTNTADNDYESPNSDGDAYDEIYSDTEAFYTDNDNNNIKKIVGGKSDDNTSIEYESNKFINIKNNQANGDGVKDVDTHSDKIINSKQSDTDKNYFNTIIDVQSKIVDSGIDASNTDVSIESSDFFEQNELRAITTNGKRDAKVKSNGPNVGQTSLVIVFDSTGSMENSLIQLRAGAQLIIDKFAERDDNPIYNYIFVPFRDPVVGPELVTTNRQELLDTLNNVTVYGGGDCPESTLYGISIALKYALPRSFVYIFTDAIAKDFTSDNEVLALIQRKQSSLTFLLTGFCDSKDSPGYYVFERLAAASNGQVYNLKTHDIKEVLNDIKESINKRRITIKYLNSPTNQTNSIDLTVDKNLNEFSVSVAGNAPKITVVDPNNQTFNEAKEAINLDNLKVIKIEDPQPGEWSVQAKADSPYSIRLTALSDIIFNFGFSLTEPQIIAETSFNPLLGQNNILSIAPSNRSLLTNLTHIQVVLINDSSINPFTFSLNLRKIQRDASKVDGDLYVTSPFQPPRQPFRIYLNGYDKYENKMKRLLSTAIQSSRNLPPEIFIEEKDIIVDEPNGFVIKCHVDSMTPVNIKWLKDEQILMELNANQTTTLVYDVNSTDSSKAGDYICRADNIIGHSEEIIGVKIVNHPLTVSIPQPEYVKIEKQLDVEIQCLVSPPQNIQVTWFFNKKPIDFTSNEYKRVGTNLIISNVMRQHTGFYTCQAIIENDQKAASTNLTVLYPPKLIDPENEDISIKYDETLNISCLAEGEPPVSIEWYFLPKFNESMKQLLDKNYFPIVHFRQTDEGIYLCEIRSEIGEPIKRTIKVRGLANKAPDIQRADVKKVFVTIGNDLMLNCRCDMCKPLTQTYWFHNSGNYTNLINAELQTNSLENQVDLPLKLANLTEADQGNYICHMENEYGSDEYEINVSVKSAPNINEMILLQDDFVNGNLTLDGLSTYIKCEMNGKPMFVIRWKLGAKDFLSDQELHVSEYLKLEKKYEFDAGIYTCHAISPSGIITRNFTLVMAGTQVITSSEAERKIVADGSMVSLPCYLNQLKSPELSWLLNGRELNTGANTKYSTVNSTIAFYANTTDSGIYECRAIDGNTVRTKEIVLVVFVEPKIYSKTNREIIRVKSNSDAILKCEATGLPIPNVTWSFEGNLLTVANSSEIILKNVTNENAGAYVCDAFNDVGIAQKIFYVIVNDPPIILSRIPMNLIVKEGKNIIIDCAAIGNPYPKIYWTRDHDHEIISNHSTLELVYNASKSLTGSYKCIAKNSLGYDSKNVNILDKPRLLISKISNSISNGVLIGEAIALTCPFEHYETKQWLKNGEKLKSSSNYLIKNDAIVFDAIAIDDRGNYTCLVENESGRNYFDYEILVNYPPIIIDDNNEFVTNDILSEMKFIDNATELEVIKGNDFILDCSVNGFPKPIVQWIFNDEIVSTNETLIINKAEINDQGIYRCNATNAHGSDEQIYKLRVLYSPAYDGNSDTFTETNAGEQIILNCSMDAIPSPIYTWFKDDVKLKNAHKEHFVLKETALSDNGTYTCRADNNIGSNEKQFHVQIYMSPQIVHITNDTIVDRQKSLNLTCKANGFPLPILTWLYNDQLILSTSKIHSIIQQLQLTNFSTAYHLDQYGNGISIPIGDQIPIVIKNEPKHLHHIARYIDSSVTLELHYTEESRKKSGKFSCVALNAIGQQSKSISVQVVTMPTIKTGVSLQQTVDVLEGLPTILNCPITGQPHPKIIWLKNKTIINNSETIKILDCGKHLNILQTSVNDSASYECIAQNMVGSMKLLFTVNVLIPPKITNIPENDDEITDENYVSETLTIVNGESINLKCPIVGNPDPEIVWIQIEYSPEGEVTKNILTENGNELNVDAIFDSTTYQCYANSTLGNVEFIYHVIVNKPPLLLSKPVDNQTINLHLGFTLHCDVHAKPEPIISWYKDNKMFGNQTDYGKITNDKFISTDGKLLRVLSSTMEHNGEYHCTGANQLGSALRYFYIEINDPVHWTPWEAWSTCSASCSLGKRIRHRHCVHQNGTIARNTDLKCNGHSEEIENCEIIPCPINGEWGSWNAWSNCSHQCVSTNTVLESKRVRYRHCDSPAPSYGGKSCFGSDFQYEVCNVPSCINGGWSDWSMWSSCSKSCGKGYQTRYRSCNNPTPENGGQICMGGSKEMQECINHSCVINGGWSDWSIWSPCSRTCGIGQRQRTRKCNKPKPSIDGRDCVGVSLEFIRCNLRTCESDYDKYGPLPDESNELGKYPNDDYEYNETNERYAEGRPEEYVNHKQSDELFSKDKENIIVRVENFIPISDGITQISFDLKNGAGQITVSQRNKCQSGYEYDSKSDKCVDLDECHHQDKCKQNEICRNTAGSYQCLCSIGYTKQNEECIKNHFN